MINPNLRRLKKILKKATKAERKVLGKIIKAPFGNSPDLLCDHMNYLRIGGLLQIFERRSYKQLVTDVADKCKIDWELLTSNKSWHDLRTAEIEKAIVEKIVRSHKSTMPENDVHAFVEFLETELGKGIRDFLQGAPLPKNIKLSLNVIQGTVIRFPTLFDPLFPQWRRLTKGVMCIHGIRKRIEDGA
jgi:hypothetical protein